MKTMKNSSVVNYSIIITGSFFFCVKGILVKELYKYGFNAEEVLTLRMIAACPFFLLAAVWMARSLRKISKRDFFWIIALSFFGYFLSSLINFLGLEHVSVGLERVILFSYPSIVLLGGMIFQKKKHSKQQIIACALTWIGLFMVVADEISFSGERRAILFGSFLIFLSALTYGGYLLFAKPVIDRMGAQKMTTLSMLFCCFFVFGYYGLKNGGQITGEFNNLTIGYALAIGIFGTVIPTYLLSFGLARVSSSSLAIVSSAGPAMTILLVAFLSRELPSFLQVTGVSLALISSTFSNLKS